MSTVLLRAVALASVYLLVLTSLAPGDILVGGLLGFAVSVALRPRAPSPSGPPAAARVGAAALGAAEVTAEMARGSWRVVRFCLGAKASPGFVEVPRDGRSRLNLGLWGVVTGEAPDEVPVEVDDDRDVLIVHLVDASHPDGVRARHRRAYVRWQRKVVP